MRSRKANLAEPDPEEFGQFEGVDGTDHARRIEHRRVHQARYQDRLRLAA
ncbi:hypothetical protein ACFRQM_51180 [Streptomyces sp. NPDC056831]